MKNNMVFLIPAFAILISCGSIDNSKTSIIGGEVALNDPSKASIFPATVGFISQTSSYGCTATRISKNTFLTAGHCLEKIRDDEEISLFSSNGKRFPAIYTRVKVISEYKPNSISVADMASFGIKFKVTEEQESFDSLVGIAPINYEKPILGQSVNIAGFGCESAISFFIIDECLKTTHFEYMKFARSEISEPDTGFFAGGNSIYFRLSVPLVFSDKINGYIGKIDSGGPVYNLSNQLIGVHSSTNAVDSPLISKGTSFHNWLGYKSTKDFIEKSLLDENSDRFISGKIQRIFLNGNAYVGEVSKGQRNGFGVMDYADTKHYEGTWLNDLRHGTGKQIWNPGAKAISFEGLWMNDRPDGKGTMVFSNGQTYTGNFIRGVIEGEGQITYPNGDVRMGRFAKDKREGPFTLIKTDGTRFVQIFSDDQLISTEKIE